MDNKPRSNLLLSEDVVDKDILQSILRLNQELVGLQTEVTTKLANIISAEDQKALQQKEQLTSLLAEIEKAFQGIHDLNKLVVTEPQ